MEGNCSKPPLRTGNSSLASYIALNLGVFETLSSSLEVSIPFVGGQYGYFWNYIMIMKLPENGKYLRITQYFKGKFFKR